MRRDKLLKKAKLNMKEILILIIPTTALAWTWINIPNAMNGFFSFFFGFPLFKKSDRHLAFCTLVLPIVTMEGWDLYHYNSPFSVWVYIYIYLLSYISCSSHWRLQFNFNGWIYKIVVRKLLVPPLSLLF